jgi:PAS domain S-box-containing protein
VITGYTRDELIRRSIWDLIHPDFQDLIRQRMLARQRGDAIPSRIEFKIVTKSSEERWVDYAGAFVELAGQPTMIGTAFDITERKWAEEALRNSREQLALVMDGVPALIAYVDSDERYLYVNKAYAEWYGRSREDYIGMRIRDLLDERVYQRASPNYKAALSGQCVSFEDRAYNKDWQERVVSVNFVPHFDEKGSAKAFFALIQDITDSKRAEEALRQSNAELQVRNEELDAFAHTVAHDLRNPLSLIVGLAKTLELDHTSLPAEEVSQYLHRLGQYALKINNIIDELLLLAGVRQTEVKLTPLDMTGIVTGALLRLTELTEAHRAEIVLPQVWPEALGYAPWVEEVWVNYLSNAIRYGGRPPHVELDAETRADGTVRFSVRDNGPGITLEDQARLFTPFTRLDQVRAKGYGLGLSIVRRIVEKLGGQVGVESQVGRGSTFYFILPESRVSENQA